MNKKPVAATVLLIDDDRDYANHLTKALEEFGIAVDIVDRDFESIRSLRELPKFDVVLVDIQLSPPPDFKLNGVELAKSLRMIREDVPIFGISGVFRENEIPEAGSAFTAFLAKGAFSVEYLSSKILQKPREKKQCFLAYNSVDIRFVRRLATVLKSYERIELWFDEWSLLPGMRWQVTIEKRIAEFDIALVVVGPSGVGPWEDFEMRAFLSEVVQRGAKIVPILAPGASGTQELPIFLRQFSWADMRMGLRKGAVETLIQGILGA